MNNEFQIGDRVRGFGPVGSLERGTVVGVSVNPPSVQVKWDRPGLVAPGAAGRWEDVADVTKVGDVEELFGLAEANANLLANLTLWLEDTKLAPDARIQGALNLLVHGRPQRAAVVRFYAEKLAK